METHHAKARHAQGLSRRELLKAGLAAGVTAAAWPLYSPPVGWGEVAGPPKRGGILRVRGFDPPNFDHHHTTAGFTQSAASFVYSKLVRHKVGADIAPGTFIIEPDLAERWEELDDTTYVFHLHQGVKWHNKPPVNGRELVADDVKSSFDRFMTEKGSPNRFLLDSVDRIDEAVLVQRYLKDVGIDAELKIQEHGAYTATTMQGKFEGLVDSPSGVTWEPDGRLYRAYAPDSPRNIGRVNDATLTAMLKEQRRTKDLDARKRLIHDNQRYVADQQYSVYLNSNTITTSWQPYVKNFAPNHSFDYGNRAAALWLDR
jgi:ABC-type transport system substrate-binding protein